MSREANWQGTQIELDGVARRQWLRRVGELKGHFPFADLTCGREITCDLTGILCSYANIDMIRRPVQQSNKKMVLVGGQSIGEFQFLVSWPPRHVGGEFAVIKLVVTPMKLSFKCHLFQSVWQCQLKCNRQ